MNCAAAIHPPPIGPTTIGAILAYGRRQLASLESGALDAEVLTAHLAATSRTGLYAFPETVLPEAIAAAICRALQARLEGVPVAYLTGEREFWGLPLQVNRQVLVPRPETELLVETALALPLDPAGVTVLDAGTGSGAIALALQHERPQWQISACDQAAATLMVARDNAQRLAAPINLIPSDWFESIVGQFDLIVSNPPYVEQDHPALGSSLRYEPRRALDGGADGLRDIRRIVATAPLRPAGYLLLEHGFDQGPRVRALFRRQGYRAVTTYHDLAGQPRVTAGQSAGQRADQGQGPHDG